jgi:hypothetical protein
MVSQTKKPAIVVTVDRKRDDLPPQDRLPETIDGFAVDVRQASPLQRLRAANPSLYASVAATADPELDRPTFPFERDLSGHSMMALAETVEAMRKPSKQQLRYVPPAGAGLKPVTDEMSIICHASPDAGWPTLKGFLEDTTHSLTVGMYDFTSSHIAETVQSVLEKRGRAMNLVLDHPPKKASLEQSDDDTVGDLEKALGNRFNFSWALERGDPKVMTWIFPSAYHIKVAVRDSGSFWLSSGNWNTSNQPDIDPIKDPTAAAPIARKSDRDWHVIIDQKDLAELYEKYLLNDLKVASENQVGPSEIAAVMSTLAQLAEPELVLASRVPQTYFPPKTIRIQEALVGRQHSRTSIAYRSPKQSDRARDGRGVDAGSGVVEPVEKPDPDAKCFGDQIQPACRHAVGAVLIFLHLLEGDGTDLCRGRSP